MTTAFIRTDKYSEDPEVSASERKFLSAALELFSEKGYHATSVREICDLAGITRPTLYYFFKSKEGLYRSLINTAASEFNDQIREGLESGKSLRDRYKSVARSFFRDARSRPRLWRFMFGLVWATPRPAVVDELFRDAYGHALFQMGAALDEGIRRGDLPPGDHQVRLLILMGALGEALSGYLIAGCPKLNDELADSLVDTILDGWANRN